MIPGTKQVRYHDGLDEFSLTAFLGCHYRIEQYLQRSNTWLLMSHVRHEQFPQANSGANSFVYAVNDSTKTSSIA